MKELSIYDYERRVWLVIEGPHGIKQSKKIPLENKERLLEYAKFLTASGKSLARQGKILITLKKVAELLGDVPFKKAEKPDIVDVLARIKGADSTKRDYQIILKQFYAWLYDIEDPRHEGFPKVVRWIHPKEPKSNFSELISRLKNWGYKIEYKLIFDNDEEAERIIKIYQEFYEGVQKPLERKQRMEPDYLSKEALERHLKELREATKRYFRQRSI